eukprot:CAMPEP_0194271646 /NCGR_PEP_ID=MMETSP0169-20130528/5371_1 /TAXON_ID=218684 /ORGANISM="Corethron pennatum, Strain L29A3" /LENGTH=616 /DNA_ID=CAMNT_0039014043 /DNA_START=165 /DNA_END=2011 /DNA_ORIENTATION=-
MKTRTSDRVRSKDAAIFVKKERQDSLKSPQSLKRARPSNPVPDCISSSKTNQIIPIEKISSKEEFPTYSAWASHNDISYHDFDQDEVVHIRRVLLIWYDNSRRKLPWRGDSPPYTGSTAKNANSGRERKRKKNEVILSPKQKQINSFFEPKSDSAQLNIKNDIKTDTSVSQDISGNEDTTAVTPYGTWVSEIMLQQTRVEAVIPYYVRWMKSFPTVEHLATASDEEVNSHWAGLGFYRRARMLQAGARTITSKFDGVIPNSVEKLLTIEGIGPYTAGAIASIAYGVVTPVLDGNVCRVLARLRGIANHIKSPILKDKLGWKLAEQIVCADGGYRPGNVNQALMELGATYCAPSGSGVDENDPLIRFYRSTRIGKDIASMLYQNGGKNRQLILKSLVDDVSKHKCMLCDPHGLVSVVYRIDEEIEKSKVSKPITESDHQLAMIAGHAAFPIPPPKKAKKEEVFAVAAIRGKFKADDTERWLMIQRPSTGLLAKQWEFPSICVWGSSTSNKTKKEEYNMSKDGLVALVDKKKRVALLTEFICQLENDCREYRLSAVRRKDVCGDKNPLEHIFSHVRHTMYVEKGEILIDSNSSFEWTASNGRNLRWMDQVDFDQVGIT